MHQMKEKIGEKNGAAVSFTSADLMSHKRTLRFFSFNPSLVGLGEP